MLASSTHDTKRSEDVRARINVLSEIPAEWSTTVTRWKTMNAGKRPLAAGRRAPDRNDEYLIYQTLIGIWPVGEKADLASLESRLAAYVEKAIREAKARTSWVNLNMAYEQACRRFIQALFEDEAFLADLAAFTEPIARTGVLNSLSQTLLKMTVPGVPDFYQGSELIDLSLVDPDNRRPVDFALRKKALAALNGDPAEVVARLMTEPLGGNAKLWMVRQGLAHRRDNAALYADGSYEPLRLVGGKRRHAIAFARGEDAIVIAPRLIHQLCGGDTPLGDAWGDTHLQLGSRWGRRSLRNVFTGEKVTPQRAGSGVRIDLRDALQTFPVALLSAD